MLIIGLVPLVVVVLVSGQFSTVVVYYRVRANWTETTQYRATQRSIAVGLL